ncbi:MAG: hypothetical protein Phog2KO_51040 [Phototrophicaceae bacterium]
MQENGRWRNGEPREDSESTTAMTITTAAVVEKSKEGIEEMGMTSIMEETEKEEDLAEWESVEVLLERKGTKEWRTRTGLIPREDEREVVKVAAESERGWITMREMEERMQGSIKHRSKRRRTIPAGTGLMGTAFSADPEMQ